MPLSCRLSRWLVISLSLTFLSTSDAAATCVSDSPMDVRWAWPHEGAEEVPVDTSMWVIPSLGATVAVRLEGATLDPGAEGGFAYDVPELDPETNYTVTAELDNGETVATVSWSFTTGEGPLDGPPPAVDLGLGLTVTSDEGHLDTECLDIWSALDCYDTGQDVHVRFGSTSEAILWEVDVVAPDGARTTATWPGQCGWPETYTTSDTLQTPELCFVVRAFDAIGRSTEAAPICPNGAPPEPTPVDPEPDPSSAEEGGCQAAGAHSAWALGLLLLLSRTRRRGRLA